MTYVWSCVLITDFDPLPDLITYCAEQGVPFTVFEDWSSILETVKKIVAGDKTVHDAAQEGYDAFKKGEVGLNGHAK